MSKKQTTSSSTTPFNGDMKGKYDSFYNTLLNYYNNPSTYTGNVSASRNGTQNDATGLLSNAANSAMLNDTVNGKYLTADSNPYLSGYADKIKSNIADSWGEQTNAIDSKINGRGFWGGSGHQTLLEKSQKNLADTQSNALNNLYGNVYSNERQNQLSAQNQLTNNANSLLNAGNNQWSQDNTANQQDFSKWVTEQGLNQQNINNIIQMLGLGRNSTTNSTSNDGGASTASGLGSIAGAFIACFPAGVMIETVGADRPVESIRVGDVVLGSTDKAGKVIRAADPVEREIIIVTAGEYQVPTTMTQEFLTPDGFKLLHELSVGDAVITKDGPTSIDSIVKTGEIKTVYDFTTDGDNSFFANGFVVEGGF